MRFTLIKNIKQDKSMKPMLNGLLVFILLFIVADFLVKYVGFGVLFEDVQVSLFGNEEEFLDPISRSAFLEFIHTEIFFIMMLLLTLSAVFNRLAKKKKYTIILTNILMISALLSLVCLGLSYFIDEFFIFLYLFSFYIWHLAAIFMSTYSLWHLNHA